MSRMLATIALASLAACGGSSTSPESLIGDPRILAIRAEPPVVEIDGSTELSALVAAGDGTRDAQLSWRACDPWQPFLSPEASCGPEVSMPLVDGRLLPQQLLEAFPPPADVVDDLVLGHDDAACDAAYPSIDVVVVLETTLDGNLLVASKRVRVALEPLGAPRRNPALEALLFDGEPFTELGPRFRSETAHTVSAAVDPDSIDPTCDDDNPSEPALESFSVNVYATAGNFDSSELELEFGLDGGEAVDETTWTTDVRSATDLWMVITDNEGGTGWSHFTLSPL